MDKNIRIAIIGGGPAGLSAGMYLEQKGYENYVIFERQDRVGGKCWSPHYNGRRYEMGAIMGVPSYYAVEDVEKFCGITHDGPKLNRNYKDSQGNVIEPFARTLGNIIKNPWMLKMKGQLKKFGELLETKYKGYDLNGHRGVAEGRYDGYAVTPGRERVQGENPNLKDLAMPFKKFCEINGVPLVQKIWIGPFTSFGYGYFDEIPAAYVLKYLDYQTCMNFVKVNLWTWKEGTQYIWEQLNDHIKHPARLNSTIEKVERRDGKVFITVNGEVEEFDKVIVTAPLHIPGKRDDGQKGMDEYFDVRDDEKELFSKIDYERYDVQAFLTKPENHPEISYYVFDNMVPEKLGHLMVYYRRWKDDTREARPPDGLLPPLEGSDRPGHHHLRAAQAQGHGRDPLRDLPPDGAGRSQDHAQPRRGSHQRVVRVLLPACLLRGLRRRLVRQGRDHAGQVRHLLCRRDHGLRRHGRDGRVLPRAG